MDSIIGVFVHNGDRAAIWIRPFDFEPEASTFHLLPQMVRSFFAIFLSAFRRVNCVQAYLEGSV